MTDQFTGQILANKYRIGSVLRDSDLGKIYRGTHLLMEKPVTIKILAPALAVDESITRHFSEEARTASQFSHQNILNVTDFGSDTDGNVYIVFEGVEGETLKSLIGFEGKLPHPRAVDISKQIAEALAAAHSNGVTHGSLTANDIILTHGAEGQEIVKVLNFASVKNDTLASIEHDHDPLHLGEIEYFSPEQCSEFGEADERSDIYSLGVILYEMLAGEVPFKADDSTELMLKHAQELAPPFSAFRQDLPVELEPIVIKALAKDPDMRYQAVAEFIADLEKVPETVITQPKAAAASNNIWKTAFIVLVGTLALAAALIYATSSRQTNPTTVLQSDANGLPIQPINPATGTDEQALANTAFLSGTAQYMGNSNVTFPMDPVPGGDGYNPWAGGPVQGAPPPTYMPPGGGVVTIDPNVGGSQFMPNDGGVVLVPVPVDENNQPVPARTPQGKGNVNTAPAPAATPGTQPRTTGTPAVKPTPKTGPSPAKTPPAGGKKPQSGKTQDS